MVLLIPGLGHGHHPIYSLQENYSFVESVVHSRAEELVRMSLTGEHTSSIKGIPFAQEIGQHTSKDENGKGDMHVRSILFKSQKAFVDGSIIYSCNYITSKPLYSFLWETQPISPNNLHADCKDNGFDCTWQISVLMPKYNTCAWFVNLISHDGLLISSILNIDFASQS